MLLSIRLAIWVLVLADSGCRSGRWTGWRWRWRWGRRWYFAVPTRLFTIDKHVAWVGLRWQWWWWWWWWWCCGVVVLWCGCVVVVVVLVVWCGVLSLRCVRVCACVGGARVSGWEQGRGEVDGDLALLLRGPCWAAWIQVLAAVGWRARRRWRRWREANRRWWTWSRPDVSRPGRIYSLVSEAADVLPAHHPNVALFAPPRAPRVLDLAVKGKECKGLLIEGIPLAAGRPHLPVLLARSTIGPETDDKHGMVQRRGTRSVEHTALVQLEDGLWG